MASRYAFGVFAAAALLAAAPAVAQRRPAATTTGLGLEVLALACAPSLVFEDPPKPLRITGGQDPVVRGSYGPGDLITINAGLITASTSVRSTTRGECSRPSAAL